MIRVIKHIFRRTIREQLPRLQNTLTSQYDPASISDDERLIMQAGVVKSPQEARRLLTAYNATNAVELLTMLPDHRPDYKKRFQRFLFSIEGSYPSNPYKHRLRPENSTESYLE